MKLSRNWLSKFVDLKGISSEEICAKLTLHTAEVDSVEHLKPFFENVFAGALLSVKAHPNSDKLSVAQFDLGKHGKKQIIFGQVHVLHIGEIYPVALAGCVLKSGMEIKDAEIRGVNSQGMVADNQELGMKNVGLIRWKDKKLIGKSLPEIEEDFGDTIFEIDNKSLTHRPDLWGHVGFARELASIFHRKLNYQVFGKNTELPLPKITLPKTEGVKIKVETQNCLRWCSLSVSGMKVGPSSLATQILLENLGIRAISNLVDITNLVLAGWGQPMHVFDAKKLDGGLVVRQARKGEKLLALDGNEYELTPEETVVADGKKVLSIAGIMGGEFSGVTESTTDVVFEVANWNPVAVRKSSVRLGLRSDSSIRYEKSLDSHLCENAILCAVHHTLEICPKAKTTSALTDSWSCSTKDRQDHSRNSATPLTPPCQGGHRGVAHYNVTHYNIMLDPAYVRMHSGLDISIPEMRQKLESVGFSVQEKKGKLEVGVPSWRATKDISIAEDLIEEIVRLYGFDNIPATLPVLPIHPPRTNWMRRLEWQIRETLLAKGLQEVYNYSFVRADDQNFTGLSHYVTVKNPLSEEQTHLRRTLISNMVRPLESELRTHGTLDFFELGRTYEDKGDVLPDERLRLALLAASLCTDHREERENQQFFDLKSQVFGLFESLNLPASFRPAEKAPAYAHPAKTAEIFIAEDPVGIIACLHPARIPVKNGVLAFAEMDMPTLLSHARSTDWKYRRLSPFPPVHRDLSVVLGERILTSDLEQNAFSSSPLLQKIEFFDEFRDPHKIGQGAKNLAFHLRFSSHEKTLEESDIDREIQKVLKTWSQKFGAKLRAEFDKEREKR